MTGGQRTPAPNRTRWDVLDAGTQGMIGYLIQQELRNLAAVVPSPQPRQIMEIEPISLAG